MTRLRVPDDVPIEAGMVTKAIRSAQTQVEQQNFEIRKNVLKYDEVLNKQRTVIYAERRRVLAGEDIQEQIAHMVTDVVDAYVDGATSEGYAEDWDLDKLWNALRTLYPVSIRWQDLTDGDGEGDLDDPGDLTRDKLAAAVLADARAAYDAREVEIDAVISAQGGMRELERQILLQVMDRKWREHLYEMDYLKEGIGLRAMAQRDPLIEYQREGFDMFSAMLDGIKEEAVGLLFKVQVQVAPPPQPAQEQPPAAQQEAQPAAAQAQPAAQPAASPPAAAQPAAAQPRGGAQPAAARRPTDKGRSPGGGRGCGGGCGARPARRAVERAAPGAAVQPPDRAALQRPVRGRHPDAHPLRQRRRRRREGPQPRRVHRHRQRALPQPTLSVRVRPQVQAVPRVAHRRPPPLTPRVVGFPRASRRFPARESRSARESGSTRAESGPRGTRVGPRDSRVGARGSRVGARGELSRGQM